MSRIKNYEDLMAERTKAENKIVEQKQIINDRIQDLKNEMEPIFHFLPFLNIFRKKDSSNGSSNHSLLKVGASLVIDLLVGQKLLGKANWLARLLVPLVLKTVTSKVIDTTENGQPAQ